MPTGVRLIAVLSDHVLTLLSQANIVEHTAFFFLLLFTLIHQLIATESALFRIEMVLVLIATFSCVVWRDHAAMAEIVFTLATSDSVLAHVDGCSGRHNIALIILRIVVDLALRGLHDVSTRALDHVRLRADELIKLALLNLLHLFFRQIIFHLRIRNLSGALWAEHCTTAGQSQLSALLEAELVHSMEALG